MCQGVPIVTHLKAFRVHPKYNLLLGEKASSLGKTSIPDSQCNDIYECLVILSLLLKVIDELLSKGVVDFGKKQAYFEKIRSY
jgi:hypothetical protein